LKPDQIDQMLAEAHAIRMEDTRRALQMAGEAGQAALRIDYQKGLATSLYLKNLCQFILGDDTGLLEEAFQVLGLFESLQDRPGAAQAHNLLALIYRRKNRFREALDHFQLSLKIRESIGDRSGQSTALNNIAVIHVAESQPDLALQHLHMALDIAESCDDVDSGAYAHANIARILMDCGDFDRALRSAAQGLELNLRTNDRALESTLLTLIGNIHLRMNQAGQAIGYLERSLSLCRGTGNLNDEGDALSALGTARVAMNRHNEARNALSAALHIFERLGLPREQSVVKRVLADCANQCGCFDEALAHLNDAAGLAEQANSIRDLGETKRQLAELHEMRGAYDKALGEFRQFHAICLRLNEADSTRRVRELSEALDRRNDPGHAAALELSHALQALRDADATNAELLSRMKKQAELLEQLAREDALTGLANRRWIDIRLEQEFDRARRFGHCLSIALIDLDDFKQVNDRFSHQTGDAVLSTIGRILREQMRSVDAAGRFGGEEFLLILVETDRESARSICGRVVRELAEFDWNSVHMGLNQITMSVGIETWNPCDPQPPESLRQMTASADQRMYRAKAEGKNRIVSSD